MSVVRAALNEARWRGFWGTVQAIKLGRFGTGMQHFVGEDHLGNKYFENRGDFYGRDRWVEYSEAGNLRQDPVHVPPDWHAWISHIIDEVPSASPLPTPSYQAPIRPNLTATSEAYISRHNPKSKHFAGLARETVEPWVPGSRSKRAVEPKEAGTERDILDLK